MSNERTRLASLIIKESFGDVVEKVGSYLLKQGDSSLPETIKGTGLKPNKVRKALCVLIQHQLCEYSPHKNGAMLYRVNIEHVLLRARFPRYIHATKVAFGDVGELIVEDILCNGQSLMSQCLQRVGERLLSAGVESGDIGRIVRDQFLKLVEGHYLQRVSRPNADLVISDDNSDAVPQEQDRFRPPPTEGITFNSRKRNREETGEETGSPHAKKAKKQDSMEEPEAKRRKGQGDDETGGAVMPTQVVDAGIFWHVNYSRFHQQFRDQAIVSIAVEKINETAGCVMNAALAASVNLMDYGRPPSVGYEIYSLQIEDKLGGTPKLSSKELDQYLHVLVDDQVKFLRRTGDSGGGSYTVSIHTNVLCDLELSCMCEVSLIVLKDFGHLANVLCQSTIESVVRERFGNKCLRVFRLLLLKKALEQKQVADLAMIPSKEAKELLYSLLSENYVTLQEIPKAGDYAPSRTFYLFSVNLPQVARLLRERCYQALGNLMQRRAAEVNKNKRLLEKFNQYTAQQQTNNSQQEEADELLTPAEKDTVQVVKRVIAKLEYGELQMDQTIFILSNYIETHTNPSSV